MNKYKIAVIVGSIRKDSLNKKLADAIIKIAPSGFSFMHVLISDLPLYNQDDDANPAESVKRLRREIGGADGLLFVTPEYNRSISGVLKNAIDHASRPHGENVWADKPAGILGVALGAAGTALAQQHLRNILACLDVPTLGQPDAFIQAKEGLFNEDGSIGSGSKQFLQTWVDRYAQWIKLHATLTGEAS
jgi:chromate reductase